MKTAHADSFLPAEPNEKARQVLAAATQVFLSHGFSAATTDMIQGAAGVSKSTVYAHFENKETLFKAVIEAQCALFAESIREIRFERGEVERVLRELGRAYLNIVLSKAGLDLFRVIIAEAPRFPALARTFYLAGPRVIAAVVAEHLASAVESGEIDVQSVGIDAAAALFFSLVRSEGQLECLTHPDSPPSPVQIDHWLNVAVTTFLRAFGTANRTR
jgi:TetR/AcrR family transcriptional regulator, mexJK operon transcriptional repressor